MLALLVITLVLFQVASKNSLNAEGLKNLQSLVGKVEKENLSLRIQVANLELLADETALLLRLEEEVMKVPRFRENLGSKLPYVCYKIIQKAKWFQDEGLETSILLALIEVESAFDPDATSVFSQDGKEYPLAYGLMQVIRSTARPYLNELGYSWSPEVLYNPETNIEVRPRSMLRASRTYRASSGR